MATSAIDIKGLPSVMTASSRVKDASYGLIGKGSEQFVSQEISVGTKLIDRKIDSEYKILDNIADELGNNTLATGCVKQA